MKNFIKGIFFISLLLPIINNILSIYNFLTDLICSLLQYKIYEIRKKMPEQENAENECQVIGFQAPMIYSNDEEEGE